MDRARAVRPQEVTQRHRSIDPETTPIAKVHVVEAGERAPTTNYTDSTNNSKRPFHVKPLLKRFANLLAVVLVLPVFLAYHLGAAVLGRHQAFPGWSQAFALLPGLVGVYLRRAFYRLVLAGCGEGTCITFGTLFSHPTAQLGRNVYVGAFCVLGDVTVEDDVLIASHVSIANGAAQHGTERLDVPVREQPGMFPRVTIGCDSWIGERAVVLADVGRHCVVAAGAVVTRPVADYAIVAGVPARTIDSRLGGKVSDLPGAVDQPAQVPGGLRKC
jgi:virginiamycin A acetyltransferase